MGERAQWWCEMAGLATGAAGVVTVAAALGGTLAAGIALMVLAVPLLILGNRRED
ncbi:hypothetical protein [Streptomyces sp. NRRL F-5135]|uniref:hypothetical protein n=1 Tax=Streptomyces sp. NRRL F-5135 TaxID=1463858 RepID=UPI000A7CEFEB|nr:hypothetical protein [Streptomyces sp. NRRL F-5135]